MQKSTINKAPVIINTKKMKELKLMYECCKDCQRENKIMVEYMNSYSKQLNIEKNV